MFMSQINAFNRPLEHFRFNGAQCTMFKLRKLQLKRIFIILQRTYIILLSKIWNREKGFDSIMMVDMYVLNERIICILIEWGSLSHQYSLGYIEYYVVCIAVLWCFCIFSMFLAFYKSWEEYLLKSNNQNVFGKLIIYRIDHAKGENFLSYLSPLKHWLYFGLWHFFHVANAFGAHGL